MHFVNEITVGSILQVVTMIAGVLLIYGQMRTEVALLKQALQFMDNRIASLESLAGVRPARVYPKAAAAVALALLLWAIQPAQTHAQNFVITNSAGKVVILDPLTVTNHVRVATTNGTFHAFPHAK